MFGGQNHPALSKAASARRKAVAGLGLEVAVSPQAPRSRAGCRAWTTPRRRMRENCSQHSVSTQLVGWVTGFGLRCRGLVRFVFPIQKVVLKIQAARQRFSFSRPSMLGPCVCSPSIQKLVIACRRCSSPKRGSLKLLWTLPL